MAKVSLSGKPLTVNPLKVSQPVGASLAFLGLARTMPLEHGARGCTSFNKLFFMRHFREPIALQTTAMDHVATVLGSDGNVIEALLTIAARNRPDVVGLITTGLAETQGVDIDGTLKQFRRDHPEHAGMAVVPVSATDTLGCLETGFALAVRAIIDHLVPKSRVAGRRPDQVTVLASSMLTPADIEAIKEWIAAFGLRAIVLPDLADSVDGHLIEEGYATLTYGGTTREDIARVGESAATLVIGSSLDKAADLLRERTGVPDYRFAGLMGLTDCDAFVHTLSRISGRPVPPAIARQRSQLQDAIVDCHFTLADVPVAIAADADLLASLGNYLADLGLRLAAAVASANTTQLTALSADEVVVGDLEDLENRARAQDVSLLVANSHGAELSARLNLPLLRAGFPLYDNVGGHARTWVGYRGSRQTVFELTNLLLARRREIPPYRSIYWQGTARAEESWEAAAPCIV
ncbi:nitrogenase iron-molybdenum cofactor biosynthesis protein NifN [Pseudothauera rhizosphaerae]|uniref:Nitrogenase iron-molybdenum cofactor biosynthesis protein NifN n=1 Tax=Pseudothauera rhizosphaerae TaxID=2565932 RepID=A0A4S4A8J8_9RHOO|nr:nitrogenase iron-molybdenum cofactor biosynthesis protein NifN [Pseudothauera rhizosphaerae]THF55147.1 nitrogenase iron-molybdenum cofactor biosynthesis protein NifN [Pseudothauera rhizosphaerae]